MPKKNICFQRKESRKFGPLMDEAEMKLQAEKWANEDYEKLTLLCERYSIKPSLNMFYELALALARELYPEKEKSGRKSKWTDLIKGALVVEVERIAKPNDPTRGVEWACRQLSKREPWASFIEKRASETSSPDPVEAIRRIYFDFRNDRWAKVSRGAFKMYEHEGSIHAWEDLILDYMKNPYPK